LLAGCGPTTRLLAGGSRNAARGRWMLEAGQDPGFAVWYGLDPDRNGDSVTIEYPHGFVCSTSVGIIRGNRIQFKGSGSQPDALITIRTPKTATAVLSYQPDVIYRLRKVSSNPYVICE